MKIAILLAMLVLTALTGACTSSPTSPRTDHPAVRTDETPDDSLTSGGHTVGSGG